MTETLFAAETPVAEISAQIPGAAEIFRRAGISFCCGGQTPLGEAANKAGVDLGRLRADLRALVARADRTPPADPAALINHLKTRYHAAHREELSWLLPMAQKVEAVHGDHEEAPLGLTEVLVSLSALLDAQMGLEEQTLFPALSRGLSPVDLELEDWFAARARVIELDEALRGITHDITLPVGACGSWTALYGGLRKLTEDLAEHRRIEDGLFTA
ncbi:DUF542 domain-containing protein [Paenirhodobacter hankyongi]|jgi:regulator of cell morphogenesis and NO signaling|uniref:Iron-sulfur cluster repair di-iron protein n=1 Tax=Paenirhodobacter hankyongi TaxID=2294033 RepID=A0A421BJQ0_9RHOB|nr:DUF542 domain-containing protein [Sinirhodobacter hankyongi]RLL61976.1 iron-sulfur cluster repair di-iron protein [Sinirhodobacter hankyongi]